MSHGRELEKCHSVIDVPVTCSVHVFVVCRVENVSEWPPVGIGVTRLETEDLVYSVPVFNEKVRNCHNYF